ncbi:F-box domain containing protein [Rhynchospora pubera]|uniref:F-box domain containing protein n=1 Tax=Rhynchospora pubera TaxID=906938 RepID=A0AAV8G8G7_9POAL|nr:F-box domain containing protein [Rhynchospora pubera]
MADTKPSCPCDKCCRVPDQKRLQLGKQLVQQGTFICQQSLIDLPAVAIYILPFLDDWDVLSMGGCSKSLHGVCESEETWKQLYKRRWCNPSTVGDSSKDDQAFTHDKGWKALYISKHRASSLAISEIYVNFEGLDSMFTPNDLFSGIELVKPLNITYEDVYFFFFRKELNVLINLIGLYYAFFCWDVSVEDLKKDMMARKVAEKKVTISWCLPVTQRYGVHMIEEKHTRVFSLEEIVETEMSFFYILRYAREHRDEVKEVIIKLCLDRNDHL